MRVTAPEFDPSADLRHSARPGTGGMGTSRTGGGRKALLAWVPGFLAALFAIIAWLCVLLALVPLLRTRSEPVRAAAEYLAIPIRPNLAYAAFLGLLATSLRRRTRVSWWFVVLFYFGPSFLGSLAGGFLSPVLFAGAVLLGGLLGVTIAARRQFTARLEPGNGWRALVTLVVGLAVAGGLAIGLVWVFPGTLAGGADRVGWAMDHVIGGLGTAAAFDVVGQPSRLMTFLCGLLGALAFLAAAWVLFRPTRRFAYLTPEQEAVVRRLLAASGERDSLGYFATRRDKTVMISPSGKAAIGYRVVFGTSLATGDPIGDPEAWPGAIEAWLAQAREFAWTPAVLGASEEAALAYQRAGLDALQIGDEAIIEVDEFSLEGRAMRGVRQAVRRVEKAGYTSRIRRHFELSPAEMATVLERADAWRYKADERGFSMALGRLGDPSDGRCVLVEARDAQGDLRAMLSFVPWGQRGLSLDLMRRDRESDNGLVEFMVTRLVDAAPQLGVERISMNFATFREVFEEGGRIGAGPFLRMSRAVAMFFSRWLQLESLYRSNAKYRPTWEPRLLCFPSSRDLARIGVAAGIAEGFLPAPSLADLLRRGRGGEPEASPLTATIEPPTVVSPEPEAVATREEVPHPRLPEQTRVRLSKLDRLRAAGIDPYPPGFARSTSAGRVRAAHADLPPDSHTGERVALAGRVVLNRDGGRLCFARLQDGDGQIQLMLDERRLGEAAQQAWREEVDLGDHVGVRGEVVTTRRGELSVAVEEWTLTAKCLRPLPDKHRGLLDPEARVRLRHVDLITNASARDLLRLRSRTVAGLREHLTRRDFVEVETPMLQRVHGGANARPFTTHINAYDLRLYLRIAPELYLKRLLVGGVEKIFELNRSFRNEGADASHNPEFTMLEAYEAYGDYLTMRTLVRELIQYAATCAHGRAVARRPDGEFDLGGEWRSVTVNEAVSQAVGEEIDNDTSVERLRKICETAGVHYNPQWTRGGLVVELYERLVEGRTVEPTFYLDFPTDISPLTRPHRCDPRMAERWDLVAFGIEIGTAYSELTDPVEQRQRLTAQSRLAAAGNPEAMEVDEEFLAALEYAMPPAGGMGLGVDRLIMMLTGRSIRETMLFPLVKPQS